MAGTRPGQVLDRCPLVFPHCWTLGETLEDEELGDYSGAAVVIHGTIRWCNEQRYRSGFGFLRPVDYCRGDPTELHRLRRRKSAAARHRQREKNVRLRQPTLPVDPAEAVA